MNSPGTSRPAAYDVLLGTPNLAADDALVAGLPEMEPPYQAQALSLLLARNHEAALAAVVAGMAEYSAELREVVVRQADALAAGVRVCMNDERFEVRRAAVLLIRESRVGHLAYLLGDALSQSCRKTSELAAEALRQLVEELPSDCLRYASSRRAMPRSDLDYLALAVKRGLSCWSIHFHGDVVVAAARLASRIESAIIQLSDDPRTKVSHAFGSVTDSERFSETAAFHMRALRSVQLRKQAILAIAAASDDESREAMLDEAWLLADREVRKSFVRVRSLGFIPEGDAAALSFDHRGRVAVRMIVCGGLGSQRKVALLRRLALGPESIASRAAVWALMDNRIEGGDDVLRAVAMRSESCLARLVEMELRRRQGSSLHPSQRDEYMANPTAAGQADEEPFEAFWSEFDTVASESRRSVVAVVQAGAADFDRCLRQKLSQRAAPDRLRALKVIKALPHVRGFEESIYLAARDPDAAVRSFAVKLLGELDNGASRRLLRAALNDSDERVHANAIEAVERLDPDALRERFDGQFASPSSRVRANAVKALLRTDIREGADRLLDMLLSELATDRISALWVVERVQLAGVAQILQGIAANDPDERVRRRARRILRTVESADSISGQSVPIAAEASS